MGMKVVVNGVIPFKGFKCVNLFGVLFVRKGSLMNESDFNHEAIHTEQMRELWYIPFYVLYLMEWVMGLFRKGNAYRNISFEREAYDNEYDLYYVKYRRRFSWIKYWQ